MFKLNQEYFCENSERIYRYDGENRQFQCFTLVKIGKYEVVDKVGMKFRFYTKNLKKIGKTGFEINET